MANRKWLGQALAVPQVNTVTPTAANSQTYTITINGKNVNFTADASATVAEITAGLTTAFNASTDPEFAEITATDSTTHVTLTADTAGVPFVNTSSATGAGTNVTATTTASAGPNDWSTADNWSGDAVPVSTDDVFIENSSVSILYGLGQSAVTLTSLTIAQTFTGTIGLPERNANGYAEYRYTDGYLAISATTVNIGRGDGTGSGRIKLNLGSVAGTVNVHNTGGGVETGIEALLLKGTSITALNVFGGSVGCGVISQLAGESTTITTLRMLGGTVRTGPACTISTKDQYGGTLNSYFTVTTCNMAGGTHNHYISTMSTVTLNGGVLNWYSPSNPTTVTINNGGVLDFSGDTRALTITNLDLYAGATYRDPYARVAVTNGPDLNQCSVPEVSVNFGKNRRMTLGTPS
jgi:hypothetical protein